MIITPLGHTEFLIDIENSSGRNVRIMVDGWYSDYAIGDLMERTVKVRFDYEQLRTVDALYISHAHCDHFDPYTLLEIFTPLARGDKGGSVYETTEQNPQSPPSSSTAPLQRSSEQLPLLLLPETLIYLKPLLEEYIPTIQIQVLRNKEVFRLHDIEIVATAFPQEYVTNEDDVLTISVASEREVLFAEIDTAPSETPETYKYLYRLFTKRNYETVCYVASRNELEGNLKILDFNTEKEREKFRGEFLHKRKEEIEWDYAKWEYEDYANVSNYMALPGFVRGFIGQGICYPRAMNEALSGLGCFTLDEVVDREMNYAREYGYEFPQKVLTPGRQYRIEEGKIENGRKECPIGTLEKFTPLRRGDGDSQGGSVPVIARLEPAPLQNGEAIQEDEEQKTGFLPESILHEGGGQEGQKKNNGNQGTPVRAYSNGPLSKDERDFEAIANQILEILNHKFLSFWFGSGVANLRDAILRNPDRTYRILITGNPPVTPLRRGEDFPVSVENQGGSALKDNNTISQPQKAIFSFSFAQNEFMRTEYIEGVHIDEDYFANDIDDFLKGKQELYSNFWHRLDLKRQYRLWTLLGANFINHDLVLKKYRLHFELAKSGKTSEDFMKEMTRDIV